MKKLKLKRIWIILLITIIALLAYPTFLTIKLVSNDYSFTSSLKIITNGLSDIAIDNKYSKTFEFALNNNDFIKENSDKYIKLDYYERKTIISDINSLIQKGYTIEDINLINKTFDEKDINALFEKELIKEISKYLEYDFFKSKNLDRYLKYHTDDYKRTIVDVNIGLDKKFYEDVNIVKDYSETVLVNKYNQLDETFVPNDLTEIKESCSNNSQKLSKVAQVAFEKMCDAALQDNRYIFANSAYRSYQDQKEVYDTYLNLYGKTYVANYVATPGYSEHQTGLAVDVGSKNSNIFGNSKEYKWMLENAYKYGFILRYTKSNQKITGYKEESWHYRYVGEEIAKYIQENNITYEEYYVMFIDK